MRDQANGQGHHRWAQQHRGGEHAYLKGADSEAGQIDRYQNANESVAKRPNSTGSEHEADIAPLTAGVTHRRRGSGIDNNITRKLSAADPLQIAMIKGLVAGAVNLALALGRGAPFPEVTPLAAAAAVGFLGYGVSLVLFVLGLRHLGTARTGAYFSTAPFIGAALALPLFGEPPTLPLIGAALLMGIGVYLHLAETHDHEHLH